jgi:esterase/lipase superfamily enzyme
MQYAERFFTDGIEVLRSQAQSMRALLEDLEQQVNKQREALQTLTRAPIDITLDVFTAPLAAYQRALDIAEAVTREGFKRVEHATGQVSQATEQSDEHQGQ